MKNKDKKIIVFSGKQFAGKDTAAKLLLDNFSSFKRIGIADAIKMKYALQKGIFLEDIEKNKSLYRQDLINLGNWGRAQDPDYWIKSILRYDGNTIVTDIRMKHELDVFLANNAFTVRVEASEEVRSQRGVIIASDDNTETELDSFDKWDYIIQNNGNYDLLSLSIKPLIAVIKKRFGDNL